MFCAQQTAVLFSTSRLQEGKRERDPTPQHRMAVKAQVEVLKESPKASKRSMSVEKSNTTDEGSHTKVSYISEL